MWRIALAILLVFTLASPVGAFEGWFKRGAVVPDGDTQTSGAVDRVGEAIILLYDVDETENEWTTVFSVMSASALFCFTPDTANLGTTAARIRLLKCPVDIVDANNNRIPDSELGCIDLGGANANTNLDGTTGNPATQNACLSIGPGLYFAQFDIDCAQAVGVETCRLTVTAEDPGER